MARTLLILGAGTAGTIVANRMVRMLPPDQWRVLVVDPDAWHLYQPGLLLLPFGVYNAADLLRRRAPTLSPEVTLLPAAVQRIDPATRKVTLSGDQVLDYDLLVVATGSHPAFGDLEGLTGPGWREKAHDFYTLEGSMALRGALDGFTGGRVVVHLHELPIKCPVAPLEMAFLTEAMLTERGLRADSTVTYVTPLDAAFTKPVAARQLGDMLARRGIDVVTDFAAASVQGEKGQLTAYDGRTVDYDLLITTPVHRGAPAIHDSGMGDDLGFVQVDPHTLQSRHWPHVFAIGDAADCPTSKAGSVAHFQAEGLSDNLLRAAQGRSPRPEFDGHANCFIETGHGKAILIDFNYETQPLPGRFPVPGVGPFVLLDESPVNHWGKLGFRSLYWQLLLPGHGLPMDPRMAMAGKWSA